MDEGDESRHKCARPGDSLICPFECDDCCFFRLEHYWPTWDKPHEIFLGAYIRQANLDAFWAREPDTVKQNLREFLAQIKVGEDLGFLTFDPPGPFRADYDCGMRAALGVLMKTQQPGRHEKKMKFSSARKARSIHTNMFKASSHGQQRSFFLRTEDG